MTLGVTPLLLLGGCFEVLTEVHLAADGSVHQTVRYSGTKEALRRLQESLQAAPVPGRRSIRTDQLFDEKAISKELEAVRGSLTGFRTWHEDSRRIAQLEVRLPDHAALSASPLIGTRTEWFFLRGEGGQVRLVCYPLGREAWRRARVEIAKIEKKPDQIRAELFEQRRTSMKGVKAMFGIGVPGKIVAASKNLAVVEDLSGAVVTIDPSHMKTLPEMLEAMAPRFEIVFEPKGELTGWKLAKTEPAWR